MLSRIAALTRTRSAAVSLRLFSSKVTGTVKWFDAKKGFGFLTPDDANKGDVFVHWSALNKSGFKSAMDGEPVEFEVLADERGKERAQNVTGPGGAELQGKPPERNQYDSYQSGGGGGGYGGGGGGGYGGGGRGGGGYNSGGGDQFGSNSGFDDGFGKDKY